MEKNIQKVLLIGSVGVDRFRIVREFCNKINVKEILGIDFHFKKVNLNGNIITLQLWDTVGHERLTRLTSALYKNSDGALLVYDIDNKESFEEISQYKDRIKKESPDVKLVLVGVKFNSQTSIEQNENNSLFKNIYNFVISYNPFSTKEQTQKTSNVSYEEGEAKAKEFGCDFFEISKFTKENVDQAFDILIEKLVS